MTTNPHRADKPIDRVLALLVDVRPSGSSGRRWSAKCPAHEDQRASLSVGQHDGGCVLLKCHAGCKLGAVLKALGLKESSLFDPACPTHGKSKQQGEGRGTSSRRAVAAAQHPSGCTLADYAAAKQLDIEKLREYGLSDLTYRGQPTLRIPYLDPTGSEGAVRYRLAMRGDNRFRWRRGDKLALYGLWRLAEATRAGYAVIVEGESDCHTLWQHGIHAVGLPGAASWQEERDASLLDDIGTIIVVIEPDRGGEAVCEWLAKSRIRDRVRLVTMPAETKDASALYLNDPQHFMERWQTLCDNAAPWIDLKHAQDQAEQRAAWDLCGAVAEEGDILGKFAQALAANGLAGEARAAKLLYLALTSRLLERPVSAKVNGPSSGGKSYLCERVLDYFPQEAYYALSAMSERALAYSQEPLTHRVLVLFEAAGLSGDFASYLIRSLLSEGRILYETVEKTPSGPQSRLIERPGPTGLLVTTTAVHLHPENETRLLSIPVDDTPAQTKAILKALAGELAGARTTGPEPDDLSVWHALQVWLRGAVGTRCGVVIPFADDLAELVPPVAVRLRRDFGMVLNLIRTHALLHQATHDCDEDGRVVATLGDYAAVHALVADLVAEGAEATVRDTIRETVAAVQALLSARQRQPDDTPATVSLTEVAHALKMDKSAVSRRVKQALEAGYLQNLEAGRGRPAKLMLGDPLPEELHILPDVAELERCCSRAHTQEGMSDPPSTTTRDDDDPSPEDDDDPPPGGGGGSSFTAATPGRGAESDLPHPSMGPDTESPDGDVVTVDTHVALESFLMALNMIDPDMPTALDVEATGLDPWMATPLLLQVALPTADGLVTFVIVLTAFDPARLSPLFAALTVRLLLGHNLDYDLRVLGHHFGFAARRVYDTLIGEAMLTAGDYDRKDLWLKHLSLGQLAERYLGLVLDKAARQTFTTVSADAVAGWRPTAEQVDYAARDVQVLPTIYRKQMERLEAEELVAATALRMAALPAVVAMELRGVCRMSMRGARGSGGWKRSRAPKGPAFRRRLRAELARPQLTGLPTCVLFHRCAARWRGWGSTYHRSIRNRWRASSMTHVSTISSAQSWRATNAGRAPSSCAPASARTFWP